MLLKDLPEKNLLMSIKLFSDEDVDARLVKLLSDKGVDIKYAEKGIRNSNLYSLACKEGRGILSRDKDFLNKILFPPSKLPAILIIRVHPPILSKLIPLVSNFIEKFSEDKFGNTWELREEGAIRVG